MIKQKNLSVGYNVVMEKELFYYIVKMYFRQSLSSNYYYYYNVHCYRNIKKILVDVVLKFWKSVLA